MRHLLAIGIGMCLSLGVSAVAFCAPDPAAYVRSDRCKDCHPDKYGGWQKTSHASTLHDPKADPAAVKGDFKAPNLGFGLRDVDYAIGGHREQRYLTRIGDELYAQPKLWSVSSRTWRSVNAWSWKKMPYRTFCKGCHVAGYAPGKGVAAEERVGCEACHGPGREHVGSAGKGPIVNPRKLADDRREMICAACHVRGADPTGVYAFPTGFTPGEDLGDSYVPTVKADDETDSQAILRGFDKWKKQRQGALSSKCEVCEIPGAAEGKKAAQPGANDFCFGCHEFKERYAEHTRHALSAEFVCSQCHAQAPKGLAAKSSVDVHSYASFVGHEEQCYDPDLGKACAVCHQDKGLDWARQTVETWKKSIEVDR